MSEIRQHFCSTLVSVLPASLDHVPTLQSIYVRESALFELFTHLILVGIHVFCSTGRRVGSKGPVPGHNDMNDGPQAENVSGWLRLPGPTDPRVKEQCILHEPLSAVNE
jgi:hypothetical protein